MPTVKIPKLARNKYNYVKGADGKNYVTQTQIMMSSGGGSTGGGGGSGNEPSSQVVSAINQAMYDKGILTYDDIKTINGYSLVGYGDIEITSSGSVDLSAYMTKQEMTAYVSKVELDNASYLNQSYLSTQMANYVTHGNLDAILSTYVTTNALNDKLENYATESYVATEIQNLHNETYTYVNAKCAEVQANAYAYTESKIVDDNLTSYNQVKQMIEDVIAYMKSTGELISAAAVDQKINDSRV